MQRCRCLSGERSLELQSFEADQSQAHCFSRPYGLRSFLATSADAKADVQSTRTTAIRFIPGRLTASLVTKATRLYALTCPGSRLSGANPSGKMTAGLLTKARVLENASNVREPDYTVITSLHDKL